MKYIIGFLVGLLACAIFGYFYLRGLSIMLAYLFNGDKHDNK